MVLSSIRRYFVSSSHYYLCLSFIFYYLRHLFFIFFCIIHIYYLEIIREIYDSTLKQNEMTLTVSASLSERLS